MMKKKNLPHISIAGTPQELVEIEMILVWLGYHVDNEEWNNLIYEDIGIVSNIICYALGHYSYHAHSGSGRSMLFHASQITEIINYVTNYK